MRAAFVLVMLSACSTADVGAINPDASVDPPEEMTAPTLDAPMPRDADVEVAGPFVGGGNIGGPFPVGGKLE